MEAYNYWSQDTSESIEHHGILGQKWGIRRYQNEDGSLTEEGRKRYLKANGTLTRAGKKELERRNKILDYGQAQDYAEKYYKSKIYGEDVVKEGLSKEQYKRYGNAIRNGMKDDGSDYKKYREIGIYNYVRDHYKDKITDLDDLSYKKYEELFYKQNAKGLAGKDQALNNNIRQLKDIMSNTKIDDILANEPIKNIPTGNDNVFGLMEKGLDQKDGKRYAELWNKFQTNSNIANMDVLDLALNVDGNDPYYGRQLGKDVDEFIELHNKAYHNVHG